MGAAGASGDREPESTSRASRGHADRTTLAALVFVLIAGVWLRTWQLGEQQLLGDEYWTLQAALQHSLTYLASHHHATDYSIALAVWDRALLRTIGLAEWGLRGPVWLMGCLVPPVAWLFLRRRLGSLETLCVVALCALSPIAILYSRFARPYIGVVLFLLLATAGWVCWLESGRLRWGVLSAASAAIALFWNVLAAPMLVGLWGAGLLMHALPRLGRDPTPLRSRGPASAAVVLAGGLLALAPMAPSLVSLLEVNRSRANAGLLTLDSVWGGLHFLLGSLRDPVLLWLIASLLLGLLLMYQSRPRLMLLLAASSLCQIAAVASSAPELVELSYVVGRYLLPALFGLLVPLGIGLAWQADRLAGLLLRGLAPEEHALARLAVAASLLAVVVALGPLPQIYSGPNGFTSHPRAYLPSAPPLLAERIPVFYRQLRESHPEGGRIAEVPWAGAFRFTPYREYQRVHGFSVWSATDDPLFAAPQLGLASVRPLSALEADTIEADYVVIHKQLAYETFFVMPGGPLGGAYRRAEPLVPLHIEQLQRAVAQRALAICRQHPGLRAVYEDEWIVAFARVR